MERTYKRDELWYIDKFGKLARIDFKIPKTLSEYCFKLNGHLSSIENGYNPDFSMSKNLQSKIRIIKFTIEKLELVNNLYSNLRSLQLAMVDFHKIDTMCSTLFEERKRLIDLLIYELNTTRELEMNRFELEEVKEKFISRDYYDLVEFEDQKRGLKPDVIKIMDELGSAISKNDEALMFASYFNPIKSDVIREIADIEEAFSPRVIKVTKEALKELEKNKQRVNELNYLSTILYLFPKTKVERRKHERDLHRLAKDYEYARRELEDLRRREKELQQAKQDIEQMRYSSTYKGLYKTDRIIRRIKKQLRALAASAKKKAHQEEVKNKQQEETIASISNDASFATEAIDYYSDKIAINEENRRRRQERGNKFHQRKIKALEQIDILKDEKEKLEKKEYSEANSEKITNLAKRIIDCQQKLKEEEKHNNDYIDGIRDIRALPERYINMRLKLKHLKNKVQTMVDQSRNKTR